MAGPDMIRTPDQRVRVFVSSALGELAAERQAVRDAVTRLRLVPVLFELGARPYPPQPVYRSYLARSLVFVGIYWQSYGWVAPGEQVSGLEDEYELSAGLPRLIYVKSPRRTASRGWRSCWPASGTKAASPTSISPILASCSSWLRMTWRCC
jgi:hypothetical protein